MEDRLRGPRLKIERADEHIAELQAEISRFLESNPYEVVSEINEQTGDLEYLVRIRAKPPERLATLIGDALHNLRSSLDLLWCQLVEAHNETVVPSDIFPISEDRNKFEATFKGVKKRIPVAAREALIALQPYRGGHDALWKLHCLDISDKHRLLLGVWSSYGAVILTFKLTPPGSDRSITPPIALREVGDRRLEDRSVLYSIPASERESEMHQDPQFTIEISLHEPPVIECEPVIPFLTQLRSLTNEVLDLISPILTK